MSQDPYIPHKHRCGWVLGKMVEGYGCGHVWEHVIDPFGEYSFIEHHKCPQCGKGPFYSTWREPDNGNKNR